MRVFDEVLSGAKLPLEHGVPFIREELPMPVSTVDRPVSALRQRMLEDMAMRGLRSRYAARLYSFCAQLRRLPGAAARYGDG